MTETTESLDLEEEIQTSTGFSVEKSDNITDEEFERLAPLVEEAHINLQECFPMVAPQEPVRLIMTRPATNLPAWTQHYSNGAYLYRVDGRHYMEFSLDTTRLSSDPYLKQHALSYLEHELAHQGHAEQQGQEAFHGINPDDVIKRRGLENASDGEKMSALGMSRSSDYSELTHAVAEGIAQFAQLRILEKKIEKADSEERRVLVQIKEQLERAVLEGTFQHIAQNEDEESLTEPASMGNEYKYGLGNIAIPLAEELGDEEAINFMLAIDLKRCNQFLQYTPIGEWDLIKTNEYEEILNKPQLLQRFQH
jgi:hypothetical protein